jgi:hypothetical protein
MSPSLFWALYFWFIIGFLVFAVQASGYHRDPVTIVVGRSIFWPLYLLRFFVKMILVVFKDLVS